MNLKHYQELPLKEQMKTSLFQILDNEDSYLHVENIYSKLKDCTIKTNWSNITLLSNLLLYFIGTTIDVFTSYATLYNLTMSNYSVFNFLYLIL